MSTAPETPSTETYLLAFNGQLNLKNAYTWSLTQIQAFMAEVVHNPNAYGVEQKVLSELQRLRTDIIDLSENGSKFLSEADYPQAISRTVNPTAAASEDEPYFLLNILTYGGVPYWCSFDLLAPMPPWMHSCVWAEEQGKQSRFHLGASLGGYLKPREKGFIWVTTLQQACFNLLSDQKTTTAGISWGSSTVTLGKGGRLVPYGNCAETYPLLHLLRNHGPNQEVYGLAVSLKYAPIVAYEHQQALNALSKPCTNCEKVIAAWGGKLENFITDDILERKAQPSKKQEYTPAEDNAEPAPKRARGKSKDDEQTLLLAQRVCRRWASCIQGSQLLQQILFFQPIQSILPEHTNILGRNPLLEANFPYWFPNEYQRSTAFGAGDMQEFLDNHAAWLHPSASWRRMLVQQPPVMTLGWIDRKESFTNRISLHRWELSLEEYGGLRMNMLYDLVVKSSDKAAAFFYWRMHWSRPDLKMYSIKPNPDIQVYRTPYYLQAMMSANAQTDVVLDTWNSPYLEARLWREFGKDTWTWDLIRGLQSPMGDLNLDVVYGSRKQQELQTWEVHLQDMYMQEMYGDLFGHPPEDGGPYPLPDDDDPDL
ncbi:hypothetical protein PENVUL_c003G08029 [Penicillium vulpinum]|uniref:Uncharacterized protein n=1 Tax=Penicillium vulpinum TaxID=29845 RepID=A0A1V6SA34_9EURO|nr:hypothetical protein PENVUL_c003G08029 [Penicillium vulpinum]